MLSQWDLVFPYVCNGFLCTFVRFGKRIWVYFQNVSGNNAVLYSLLPSTLSLLVARRKPELILNLPRVR